MDGRIFIRKYIPLRDTSTRRRALFVLTCKLPFQTISKLDPKFIALHCQEVGGKNYEQSMRHVEDFVR